MISGSNPGILIKRIIAYAFTVLVMVSIFSFSAQPASRSANTSKGITKKIVNAITKNKNISQKKKNEMAKKWNNFIRKAAHFALYLLLGASSFSSASLTFIKKGKHFVQKNALIAFAFSVLYAISDEIHQLYVPGRSCELRDVLIDASGSIVGIFIISSVLYLLCRKRQSQLPNLLNDIT